MAKAKNSKVKRPKKYPASEMAELRLLFAEYREKYRTHRTEPRSIDFVIADMKESLGEHHPFFVARRKKGLTDKGLNSNLNRFVNGKQTAPETVDVIRQFLELKKVDDEDIYEENEEARIVHGVLANGSTQARRVFEAIPDGKFMARNPSDPAQIVELEFTCDREAMIIWIIERNYPDRSMTQKKSMQGGHRTGSVRTGYGFLTTERYLLHVFLTGGHTRDRIHYVELGHLLSTGKPFLFRVGGFDDGNRQTLPPPGTLHIFDVCHFNHGSAPPYRQLTSVEMFGPFDDPHRPMSWMGPPQGLAWNVHPEGLTTDPHRADRDLIAAARTNDTIRFAMAKGANPNYQDEEGMTALHHAAARSARYAFGELIALPQCDYLIPDIYGRYASDLAIAWGHDFGMARLLEKKRLIQAAATGRNSREYWRIK